MHEMVLFLELMSVAVASLPKGTRVTGSVTSKPA